MENELGIVNSREIESLEKVRLERIKQNLEVVSDIESLSGEEDKIRQYLQSKALEFGIETDIDRAGNVWFLSDSPEGEVLLNAHMDKVGGTSRAIESNGKINGRLDNSLGISVILGLLQEEIRPSVVFTVEEESEREKISESGERSFVKRDLREGKYNFGARTAAEEIYEGKYKKPKLAITVDVSAAGMLGNGPLVYMSSSVFRFPNEGVKFISKLVSQNKLHAQFLNGPANDSIEFSFLRKSGTLAIEIPVENLHTDSERSDVADIKEAAELLSLVIKNHDMIPEMIDEPTHREFSDITSI